VAVAGCFLAAAHAGPPPPADVRITSVHHRPVAGKTFTGVTITSLDTWGIATVTCDMMVGHKALQGHERAFYADGITGAAAVSCAWRIPARAAGKLLHGSISVVTGNGTNVVSPVFGWRIKRAA
jgi:hypothetical protein